MADETRGNISVQDMSILDLAQAQGRLYQQLLHIQNDLIVINQEINARKKQEGGIESNGENTKPTK